MYETHFGLARRPFRATPDPDSYYPATTHERALALVSQGFQDEEGLAILTGEPGTGKTLVSQALLDRIGDGYTCAFLTNAHFADRSALFQAILYDLGHEAAHGGEQDLRLALTERLLQDFAEGRKTIVVVDEAQHLNVDLLEELRLLGNLEGRRGKAVQILLVAQPELHRRLAVPELRVLDQRLAIRASLEPMDIHESADFLLHQLRAAGAKPENLISDEALELLARAGRGVPRLLNRAAHSAFSVAHHAETRFVDAESALEALDRLGLETSDAAATVEESLQKHASEEDVEDPTTVICLGEETHAAEASMTEEQDGLRRIFASPRRPA